MGGVARVTLQTIADQVGVSRMTVSNAFSRPDQLSEPLRRTILDAAAALGYSGPDPAARALARGTTGSVGVLLTSSLRSAFDDEVATAFLAGVADELGPTGLAVTLLPAGYEADGDVVPARDVALDGAVVYSCDPDTGALGWLRRRGLPLVLADQEPTDELSCVNVDDRGGARAAAAHLVDLGHRRVAVLSAGTRGVPAATGHGLGDQMGVGMADAQCSRYVVEERLRGYLDGLAAGGVTPEVRSQPHSDDEQARAAAADLLRGHARPTAVLCFSDLIAHGVVRAAEDLGLDVPGDVSVVGFDDSPLAHRMRPGLTTVHQDVPAKGRLAAAALRAAMTDARAGTPHAATQVVLPTRLVVRESTAPPPDATRH